MVPQFIRVGNKSARPAYIRNGAHQLGSDASTLTLLSIVRIFQVAHPLTATTRRAL
jgi:hypothetical protein